MGLRSRAAAARGGLQRRRWERVWPGLVAALLCLAFFGQAVSSAVLKSPTFDEEFHVARAFAYTRANDLRMQQNHPPLVSAIAGLSLLLMPELPAPSTVPGWDDAFLFTFADELFWRLGNDVEVMVFGTMLSSSPSPTSSSGAWGTTSR
jgi:hypothetical protein